MHRSDFEDPVRNLYWRSWAAFLCGVDSYTGVCYDHRREWIRERLLFLDSIFGIDCLTYTISSKELHLVLRSRPDLVSRWNDDEVLRRTTRLFPSLPVNESQTFGPSGAEPHSIKHDSKFLAERRQRLSYLSWWIRCTAQHIACMSNREDKVTGYFFESRSKTRLLNDEASLQDCPPELDLRPIHVALTENLEIGSGSRIEDHVESTPAPRGNRATSSSMSDVQRRGQRIIKIGKSNWR